MTAGDDDWPPAAGNLVKAWKSWRRLARILSREGAGKRVSGNFFKAVVQQVILLGAETWVLTPRIERELDTPTIFYVVVDVVVRHWVTMSLDKFETRGERF